MPACGPELDFTSALFLGLRHPHRVLAPWAALTTGRPPVLDRAGAGPRAGRLADLLGAERVAVRRTSLHALLDVLGALAGSSGAIVIDAAAYPISHWAAAAAQVTPTTAQKGPTVLHYRHHDAGHAAALCRRFLASTPGRAGAGGQHRRPIVIVTDGWCSSCGRPAPVADLATVARWAGGHLVIDDSLAIGILGRRRQAGTGATTGMGGLRPDDAWFGVGGAGLAAWAGPDAAGPEVITVASLAKGHGVPLATIAGHAEPVEQVERVSQTTSHASGPTAADLAALDAVLAVPPDRLDARRRRLARLTAILHRRFRQQGLLPVGLPFPFVLADAGAQAVALAQSLDRAGIGVLAIEQRCRRTAGAAAAPLPLLGVALRADHSPHDVAALSQALDRALTRLGTGRGAGVAGRAPGSRP